jgi:hypothetical protein
MALVRAEVEQQPLLTFSLNGGTARQALDWIALGPNQWLIYDSAIVVTADDPPPGREDDRPRNAAVPPVRRFDFRLYDVADMLASAVGEEAPGRNAALLSLADILAGAPRAAEACREAHVWNGYLIVRAASGEHDRLLSAIESVRSVEEATPHIVAESASVPEARSESPAPEEQEEPEKGEEDRPRKAGREKEDIPEVVPEQVEAEKGEAPREE